jgi:hypothetical protein
MTGEIERRGGSRRRRQPDNPGYSAARKAGELDPEWVMAGVDVPAGKRLYASRELKGSAFAVAVDEQWDGDGWHLTTTMCRMLVITKPTYAECLAELMAIWQNWDNEGRETSAERSGQREGAVVSEDYDREMAWIQSDVKGRLSAEYDARVKAVLNGGEPAEGDALDLSPVILDRRMISDDLIRDLGGDPDAQGL